MTGEFGLQSDSPAAVFLELIDRVFTADPYERAAADDAPSSVSDRVRRCLVKDDLSEVSDELRKLRLAGAFNTLGDSLRVLREIDRFFLRIHPRSKKVVGGASPHLPKWLRELRQSWMESGLYARSQDYALVPRGPLWAREREAIESNSDSVADRYVALSRVPLVVYHEARPITVRTLWIGTSAIEGVIPQPSPSKESFCFVPLAECSGELNLSPRSVNGKHFVSYSLNPEAAAARRMGEALKATPGVDIAIASELVFSELEVRAFQALLGATPNMPRLTVAGSGNTDPGKGVPPWNESSILNSVGKVLWRQQKVSPAGLHSGRAGELGLPDPGETGQVMEDNRAGQELVVADVEGLGRCVVLICQDFETSPLADEVIRQFQPDWVFVPILDWGVREGRWMHLRALALSKHSHARFLICSSTALPPPSGTSGQIHCGAAVGPLGRTDLDSGRLVLLVAGAGAPQVAQATWGEGGAWKTSTLAAASTNPS